MKQIKYIFRVVGVVQLDETKKPDDKKLEILKELLADVLDFAGLRVEKITLEIDESESR